MLYLAVLGLVVFAITSFYLQGLAERIRRQFQQKYPEILAELAPDVSDTWKHFAWQGASTVAQAVLHHIPGLDDSELSRDAAKFKVGQIVFVVSWLVMAASFIAWTRLG